MQMRRFDGGVEQGKWGGAVAASLLHAGCEGAAAETKCTISPSGVRHELVDYNLLPFVKQ